MNTESKVLKSHKPSITIKAARRNAASTIDWTDTLSELIDNAILVDKNKCVEVIVTMHYDEDEEKSFIQVVDDSIGIPEKDILNVFNYGSSANSGKMLLGKMGMGLKGAIWGLGHFEYAITKTASGTKCEVRPHPYDSDDEELIYEQVECEKPILDAQKHGTCIRIRRVSNTLPKWSNRKHFDKFVEKLNSMYAFLLHENRVNIKLYYSNSNGITFTATCRGSFPLMSNPRHILNSSPEINIGHNEPTYKEGALEKIDRVEIKTANTVVYLTSWHKPTPTQVEKYYALTKDETYNPAKYKNSVFGYGSAHAGICVLYKGKFVQFGLEKASSRESDKGIIIEILEDSGLKFTQYKNTFVQDNNYRECLDAVNTYLETHGFMIRSISGVPQVSENEIVLKFIDFLRNDPIYCQSFGIINFNEQVKTWVASEVGEADIIIYDFHDKDKVTAVIEAKKDRCGAEEARQLWGYMCEFGCNRGILLTGAMEQPTFRAQIQAFKRCHAGFDMEIANVNSLTSSKFFI